VKVGDLVNNTHALDRSGLGIIVEIRKREAFYGCDYRVRWINPPPGCPDYSWNSTAWLEKV
jgi:hypothetical protein